MTRLCPTQLVLETSLGGLTLFSRGKVRDVYELPGDRLLIVATDRISAFDVVMAEGIPNKGCVLTQLSCFWFEFIRGSFASHFLTANVCEYPAELKPHLEILQGRSMLARKAQAFPVECVVRGYLAGSGWKDYQRSGSVCGVKLPPGLAESAKLESPIFTPATKARAEHDENIPWEQMADLIGKREAEILRDNSLTLYSRARNYAETRGVLIADTKFEWGRWEDRIILIDEVLTPDSSRFWPKDSYRPGGPQPSFDKQFVRDYLESLGWNKKAPPPPLPPDVVAQTSAKYLDAYERLTGEALETARAADRPVASI